MGSRQPNKSRDVAGGRHQANQAPPPKRAEPKPTKDAEKPRDAKGTGPNGNGGNGNGNDKKNGGNGSANGGEGNGRSATSPLSKALVDGLVKVIGAFFTTAGFLTFVAVTGGAITWVRFWATKLPADQALQVVPRDDQIIVGAVALGLFTVLGVIAVAGVYAIDSAGRPTDGMRVALALLKKDVVPLLADTFFDVDQFELQEEGKPRLRRLRRRLRSQFKGIQRIRLKGYADYTGSISHNDKLSRRRAREVRDFLLAGDILRRLMTYRGFGESEAEAKTRNDPRRKRDRRVDVIVIYK